MTVRVRFAPSPTGYLHIGGARTALFNWLFAKKMGGTFILRIEDTDEARSTEESVSAILDSMKWLGLDWDEGPDEIKGEKIEGKCDSEIIEIFESGKKGPYFQMERKALGIYQKYIDQLIAEDKAYPCYCTPEEVDAMRKRAQAEKKPPKYDGTCCRLGAAERAQKEAEGRSAVIRFKMPQAGAIEFDDIIRGHLTFDNTLLDDFVIMKASGVPTYNFACVIDDHLMEISHVIRGDDHLSNTPRQVHLYNALGWQHPVFAHLSMILGPDGTRLSKRHGHTSVLEYKNDGYLPEAMINYLGLLGWSTEESQQLFASGEMVEKFSLERCSKSPAVFDPQKLVWMNGEYVRALQGEKLYEVFASWVKETGNGGKIAHWNNELLRRIFIVEFEKVKLLKDAFELFDFFFTDNVEYNPEAVAKVFKTPTAKSVLDDSVLRLADMADFSAAALEQFARNLAVEKGLKTGLVFHPLRVAVSGKTTGPGLFHMMELLGKEAVLARIKTALSRFFL